MSQYQSFFYKCVWNCGIQILVEYKDIQQAGEKNGHQKIDWRASLATDEQRELFDKLKDFAEELFSEYQKICSKFFTQLLTRDRQH